MQRWKCKLDISKVTVTFLHRLSTSLAVPDLARKAHKRVERAIRRRSSSTGKIVQCTITYFDDALIYYVLA